MKYKFNFYKEDKIVSSQFLYAHGKENAFKMADKILASNGHLYDDWEFIEYY